MVATLGGVVCIAMLIAACGGGTDTTDTTAPESPNETTDDLVTTTESDELVEAPPLAGTEWVITIYDMPTGGMTNTWKAPVTIAFGEDGTLSGSAGCNDYMAKWSVEGGYDEFVSGQPDPNDGQVIRFDSLSWTEIACEDEDVMQQETEILDLLQRAGRWVIIRDSFNLRSSEGSFLLEAEPT
ncbi:MAG: META domain-containing protein [Acidimicrobiia bacterium]